ncbi:MAG: outer membrane protein assembly factor BamD [Halothiobacillaceae bacterium]|nr:outer membrane protein assembly factor BamD [Halothiobacillaceae bacterium]
MIRRHAHLIALLAGALLLNSCSFFDRKENKRIEEDPMISAAQLYNEASAALKRGNYEEAIQKYETLEGRYPFGGYSEQAKLEAAYAYYKFDEPESAIAAADRYIKLHPRGENVDYALYLKGLANMSRGQGLIYRVVERDPSKRDQESLQNAFQAFSELIQRFPQSRYVEDSHKRLIELRNMLAERELYVAQYYMKRGAWLAAANRAQVIVESYNGAAIMPDALTLLIEAYDKLGMTEQAEATRRVLEHNFPDKARQGKSGWFGGN